MISRRGVKVTTVLLAVILVVALLAACGSNNGQSTGSSSSSGSSGSSSSGGSSGGSDKESITLRITWAGSQVRHDATLKALELYTAKNPHITFEPDYMGWDTYYTKMATQSAAKTLPDIVQIDTDNIVEYSLRGQFADLSSGINSSDIASNLMEAGKINGVQYGFPLGVNVNAFLYNKSALEKLGVVVPEGGWTWDEFLAMARATQPKLEQGKYMLEDLSVAISIAEIDRYEIYQLAKGKGYSHTGDGKFNIDKDTFVEFYNLYAQLREEGVVPPVNVTMGHKEYDPMQDNLLNGTVLFLRNYAAAYGAYDSVREGEIGMMTVPRGTHSGEYLLPTQFFAISSASPHVEEAKAFIDWFVNDEEAGNALLLNRGKQVSAKISDAILPKLSDREKTQVAMIDLAAKEANSYYPRPKGFATFSDDNFPKISQEIAFGRITPEEGYEQLKKAFEEYVE